MESTRSRLDFRAAKQCEQSPQGAPQTPMQRATKPLSLLRELQVVLQILWLLVEV